MKSINPMDKQHAMKMYGKVDIGLLVLLTSALTESRR
jgi:hypothetical protein